jgi:hypothetical protein
MIHTAHKAIMIHARSHIIIMQHPSCHVDLSTDRRPSRSQALATAQQELRMLTSMVSNRRRSALMTGDVPLVTASASVRRASCFTPDSGQLIPLMVGSGSRTGSQGVTGIGIFSPLALTYPIVASPTCCRPRISRLLQKAKRNFNGSGCRPNNCEVRSPLGPLVQTQMPPV